MDSVEVSLDRRAVLSAVAAGLSATAGCSSVLGSRKGSSTPVSILAAGSLNNALENGLWPSVDAPVQVEAHGSTEVARLVADGQKDPDIVSVAATSLFQTLLEPRWFAEFATNSMVIAYNPESEGGQELAAAGPQRWYEPLLRGDVALGRTDPDLDPLGYRALFVLELATDYYGTETNLREAIPSSDQVYPETQLISQFETGSIDAAIAYRNMAVERGYDYIDLPPEIDLSDPSFSETYSTASYELPSGTVVSGGVIRYAAAIRNRSPAVVDAFTDLTSGQYLADFGFRVPEDYPRFTGNVPDEIAN